MERLGDDELGSIFSKIKYRNARRSFSQVSKRFLKVACIRLSKLQTRFPDLIYTLSASRKLISFECCRPISNNHIKHLAQSCPNIHFLKLCLLYPDPLVYDFDDDGLRAVANACSHLVEVDLSRRLHVGDLGVVSLVRSSKNLIWLTLEGCVNVTNESLKAIGEASRLENLDLTGCILITDLGLEYLANGDLKTCLKTLVLGKCDRITDDRILHLKQMVRLVSLDLSDCGVNITGSQLYHIPNIENLSLCRLIMLTDDALFGIAKCLKLTELNLTGCKAITGKSLRAFSHHLTLAKLEVSACHNYSWEDVKSVALTSSNLGSLHLNRMPEAGSCSYIGNCLISWHDGDPMNLTERCIEFGRMAQPENNNAMASAFKGFFEREKLIGKNFNDWYRSLRIVLRMMGTYELLSNPFPPAPADTATNAERAEYAKEFKKHDDVACLMLGSMSPALQKKFENYTPQDMLVELRKMFEKPPAVEIYDLVDTLHSCKQAPGESVSDHVLKMKGYMDQLHILGKPYDNDMSINLINRSFNKDFSDLVRNFNMHCVGKTVTDLHALLIDFEKGLKAKAPTPQVLTIQKGKVNKPKPQANKRANGKGKQDKGKQVVTYQKPKSNPPQKKNNSQKDQACHHCNTLGHWKRNCPLFLNELQQNKNKKPEQGTTASEV